MNPEEVGVYLFGFVEGWRVKTDTWHENLAEALKQAEFEYEGIARKWRYYPPPDFSP